MPKMISGLITYQPPGDLPKYLSLYLISSSLYNGQNYVTFWLVSQATSTAKNLLLPLPQQVFACCDSPQACREIFLEFSINLDILNFFIIEHMHVDQQHN